MHQIFAIFSDTDVSQGSSATPLRCGGIVNDDFVACLPMNLSVKKFENRSTFGEVMDNIVVPCFFLTHGVYTYVRTSVTADVMVSSVANDVTMRTGAASAVGARSHNENDVIMGMGCERRRGETS